MVHNVARVLGNRSSSLGHNRFVMAPVRSSVQNYGTFIHTISLRYNGQTSADFHPYPSPEISLLM